MKRQVRGSRDEALSAAMDRLLEGKPVKSDGRLTIANLAREAGVSRATANRATNILTKFRQAVEQKRVMEQTTNSAPLSSEDERRIAHVRAQQIQARALLSEAN